MMKRIYIFFILSVLMFQSGFCQEKETGSRILFHGIMMDAGSLIPISNSQILINNSLTSVAGTNGTFSLYVNRKDTVLFKHLGYKPTSMFVSDTLGGLEYAAGIYMQSDTLMIGEVVIVPRFTNLRSEIMKGPRRVSPAIENAKYNVAVSGYQGRTTQGQLGDPATNYSLLRQRLKTNAYEKGEIPSDMIGGINGLFLLPAAYLLLRGSSEGSSPMERSLTQDELALIQKKYFDSLKQQK
jgi:hypothetical protein